MKNKVKQTKKQLEELIQAFEGDKDVTLFFLKWIEKGMNATQAYLELHPGVDPASARVLGSRALARVNIKAILESYGLGFETYMEQLRDGVKAVRSDITGQVYPDHKTRKGYHETLGRLLGVDKNNTADNLKSKTTIEEFFND